jgi:16S rRNA processing protein RimM
VVGMEVVTEEGKRVGVVLEILRLPSNDLWQVDSGTKTISIPAVKEFIRKVDEKTRTVVIHEIEGLLDL